MELYAADRALIEHKKFYRRACGQSLHHSVVLINHNNKSSEIVQAFAQRHGIPNLALSNAGTAGLRLREGVELYLERVADNDKLFIYLIIGNAPSSPQERQAYFEHLLTLNCLEQGSMCGTLAIDSLTGATLLQTGISEDDLSVARLEQAAQALLDHRPCIADSLKRFGEIGAMPKKAVPPTMARLSRRNASGGAA